MLQSKGYFKDSLMDLSISFWSAEDNTALRYGIVRVIAIKSDIRHTAVSIQIGEALE
jgi:hypothetical protein